MASLKQSPVLLYLIILLGVAAGFLYLAQTDPAAEVPALDPRLTLASMRGLEGLSIDFGLLADPRVSSLRVFGELPVRPGTAGTDNPFR